jgi:hypothetical protein
MEMHDAWFFIGVFVFIFLIWIATGGPLHPIAFTGPRLAQPDVLGGGTYLQLPRAPYGVGGTNVVLPGSSGGGSSYYGSSGSSNNGGVPAALDGVSFGTPSPYRGVVTMRSYVSNASSSNSGTEYVQIEVAQNAGAAVDITGWKLVSEVTGKAAIIPRGTVVPTSGVVNQTQNILLAPGERAALVTGLSPIGTSFRENKCVGYLTTFQQFSPSLPQNCPDPSDELVTYYGAYYIRDASCIDYVNRLGRCESVLFPSKQETKACQNFVVQHLNYNGCVSTHQTDPDFHGTTWRIYLGLSKHLWRSQHEIVKLLDSSNRTVAAFSY